MDGARYGVSNGAALPLFARSLGETLCHSHSGWPRPPPRSLCAGMPQASTANNGFSAASSAPRRPSPQPSNLSLFGRVEAATKRAIRSGPTPSLRRPPLACPRPPYHPPPSPPPPHNQIVRQHPSPSPRAHRAGAGVPCTYVGVSECALMPGLVWGELGGGIGGGGGDEGGRRGPLLDGWHSGRLGRDGGVDPFLHHDTHRDPCALGPTLV